MSAQQKVQVSLHIQPEPDLLLSCTGVTLCAYTGVTLCAYTGVTLCAYTIWSEFSKGAHTKAYFSQVEAHVTLNPSQAE